MATPTRLDRYVSRVEQDQRTHDLLILIHTHRGKGWEWRKITLALADAMGDCDSWPPDALTLAFRTYAGPYRLWETVMYVIAEALGQERERDAEVEGIQH